MASGGLDALAAIERDHPDIVVLDVGLPGVDGFEVCGGCGRPVTRRR
jgi:two-component system response regulator MprA